MFYSILLGMNLILGLNTWTKPEEDLQKKPIQWQENNSNDEELTPEDLQSAILKFQKSHFLLPEGNRSAEILRTMKTSRCGLHRLTPNSKGKWKKFHLNWCLKIPSKKLSLCVQRKMIKLAFRIWSQDTNFKFTEVSCDNADIRFSFTWRYPPNGHSFDGQGSSQVYVHVAAKNIPDLKDVDIFFDEAESWQTDDTRKASLVFAASHAIGHSLGLGHSTDPRSVMVFRFDYPVSVLSLSDLKALQHLYGESVLVKMSATKMTTVQWEKPITNELTFHKTETLNIEPTHDPSKLRPENKTEEQLDSQMTRAPLSVFELVTKPNRNRNLYSDSVAAFTDGLGQNPNDKKEAGNKMKSFAEINQKPQTEDHSFLESEPEIGSKNQTDYNQIHDLTFTTNGISVTMENFKFQRPTTKEVRSQEKFKENLVKLPILETAGNFQSKTQAEAEKASHIVNSNFLPKTLNSRNRPTFYTRHKKVGNFTKVEENNEKNYKDSLFKSEPEQKKKMVSREKYYQEFDQTLVSTTTTENLKVETIPTISRKTKMVIQSEEFKGSLKNPPRSKKAFFKDSETLSSKHQTNSEELRRKLEMKEKFKNYSDGNFSINSETTTIEIQKTRNNETDMSTVDSAFILTKSIDVRTKSTLTQRNKSAFDQMPIVSSKYSKILNPQLSTFENRSDRISLTFLSGRFHNKFTVKNTESITDNSTLHKINETVFLSNNLTEELVTTADFYPNNTTNVYQDGKIRGKGSCQCYEKMANCESIFCLFLDKILQACCYIYTKVCVFIYLSIHI